MKRLLIAIVVLTLVLVGCGPQRVIRSDGVVAPVGFNHAVVTDKLENLRGHKFALEVQTDDGRVFVGAISETEFKRASIGKYAVIRIGNLVRPHEIRVPAEAVN